MLTFPKREKEKNYGFFIIKPKEDFPFTEVKISDNFVKTILTYSNIFCTKPYQFLPMIINIDPNQQNAIHWMVLYSTPRGCLSCSFSYGDKRMYNQIIKNDKDFNEIFYMNDYSSYFRFTDKYKVFQLISKKHWESYDPVSKTRDNYWNIDEWNKMIKYITTSLSVNDYTALTERMTFFIANNM